MLELRNELFYHNLIVLLNLLEYYYVHLLYQIIIDNVINNSQLHVQVFHFHVQQHNVKHMNLTDRVQVYQYHLDMNSVDKVLPVCNSDL